MNQAVADVILANEAKRCEALLAADLSALEPLLSERLAFGHANAVTDDKAQLLTKMASGNIVYQTLEVTVTRIIELGETVLLLSRLTAQVTVGGQEKLIDNQTLSVWVNEAGQWRLVAYQPTPIPRAS